jgi:hypothetical protein
VLKRILKWVAICIAVVVLAIGLFVLVLLNPEWRMPSQKGPDGVEIRVIAGCSEALKYGEPNRVASSTRSDTTLKTVVLANATCGAVFPVEPRASVKNDHVEVSWSWWSDPIGFFAKCTCTRHIEFNVPNVQSASPKVTVASDVKGIH